MFYFYSTFRLGVTIMKGKMTIFWGQDNHLVGRK